MSRSRERMKRWKRIGFYHAGLPQPETVSIWIERQRLDVTLIHGDTCSAIANRLADLLKKNKHSQRKGRHDQ